MSAKKQTTAKKTNSATTDRINKQLADPNRKPGDPIKFDIEIPVEMVSRLVMLNGMYCPRCAERHARLTPKKFSGRPLFIYGVKDDKVGRINGWAMCPKMKEPILFTIAERTL